MYNLYFVKDKELKEYQVNTLEEEEILKTVDIYLGNRRHVLINPDQTTGRLYYSPVDYAEFKIINKN